MKRKYKRDEEVYSLYLTIAKFVTPRLRRFKKMTMSYPGNLKDVEEWYLILDKMIFAMEKLAAQNDDDPNDWPKIEEGINLFAEYFRDLWS